MFTIIDTKNWARKSIFDFFREFDDPFFNLVASVDVTHLRKRCKAENSSFSTAVLYASMCAVNAVEPFRYRLLDDGSVVSYDVIHAGSTILLSDNSFRFCYFDFHPDRAAFFEDAAIRIENCRNEIKIDPRGAALDLVHYSIIPWIAFSGLKHAKRLGRLDSIPKITFGKYEPANSRLLMPVSVEVNHALLDAYHVAQYLETFQDALNAR